MVRINTDWNSSMADNNRRGDECGLLRNFVNSNIDPRSKGHRLIGELTKHVERMLNTMAVTLGVRPGRDISCDDIVPYKDFFEKGHSEEYQFGEITLMLTLKIVPPGLLKFTIITKPVDPAPKKEDDPVDAARPRFQNEYTDKRLRLDSLVNIAQGNGLTPSYTCEDFAVLPASAAAMSSLAQPLVMFADNHGMDFYVQGVEADCVAYIFVDKDGRDA